MKVAFVHDYLKDMGGAERVLQEIKKMFPQAPIYTAFKSGEKWQELGDVRESWAKYLPGMPGWASIYVPISPWFFRSWDLTEYDLVIISATGAYFPNGVRVGKNTKVVTYCHTPPRFLYGYPVATTIRYKWYWRPISEMVNHLLRIIDFKLAQRPDLFIANSREVAGRIRKFYRRESEVVYPPVEGAKVQSSRGTKADYFLMVSRIVGSKNIELAVEAANKYGFKLKIAGAKVGRSGEEIVGKIRGNAEYLGEVSEEEKTKLLAGAVGVLCLEEWADFGIVAVEPQMYGIPVAVFRNAGYLETIIESVTGVFVEKLTVEGVGEVMKKLQNAQWDQNIIKKRAKKFGEEEFRRGIRTALQKVLQTDKI